MKTTKRNPNTYTPRKNSDIISRVADRYAVGTTAHVRSAMQSTDPTTDPVARQYIPTLDELAISPQENADPIGDHAHSPVKGIVHRYPDRALYKITTVCAVYCRYCFRKSMVGPGQDILKKSERAAAIQYLKDTPKIWEVILTGGDPLMLAAPQINETLTDLEAIPHIQTLRIHTRTPIADPVRITDSLTTALTRDKALYIVLHINHVQEITDDVIAAIKKLQQTGAVLLCQSVLLKSVNDSAEALESLFRKLITLKIKPYMLHHLDPAEGTEHFRVSIKRGQDIMRQLRGNLSGIALPEYMLDIPGGAGKIPLTPSYCTHTETHTDTNTHTSTYTLTDYQGHTHNYKDTAE